MFYLIYTICMISIKIQVICFMNKRLVQHFYKAKSIFVKVTVIRIQIVFQHSLNKSSGLDLSFYERCKKKIYLSDRKLTVKVLMSVFFPMRVE